MEKTKTVKKYALKHFLFVGVVGGYIIAQILTAIINQPIGMFLYRNTSSPINNATNDAILTIISFLIILFSIYLGNVLFVKIIKKNFIPKEQITKSTILFSIFISIFLTINNQIPSMLNAYLGCLSSTCKAINPSITTIPIYFLMYLFRLITIPLGFLFISQKYFSKNNF